MPFTDQLNSDQISILTAVWEAAKLQQKVRFRDLVRLTSYRGPGGVYSCIVGLEKRGWLQREAIRTWGGPVSRRFSRYTVGPKFGGMLHGIPLRIIEDEDDMPGRQQTRRVTHYRSPVAVAS